MLSTTYISKVDYVYRILLQNIITGQLTPGTRLVEKDLADEFGVSNTPIREALKKLKREGLVEAKSHQGSYVTEVSLEEAKEIYEFREVIEGLASKRATERANNNQIAELKQIIERMKQSLRNDNLEAYSGLNEEFHNMVAKISGKRSSRYIRDLRNQSKVLMQYPAVLRPETSFKEHKEIMAAIEKRDPEQAELLVRKHIKKAKKDVLESMCSK